VELSGRDLQVSRRAALTGAFGVLGQGKGQSAPAAAHVSVEYHGGFILRSIPRKGVDPSSTHPRSSLVQVAMSVREQSNFPDTAQAAPARSAGRCSALICFLLGLLATLPLVILTPPFQVSDENQHFLHAYQLSELHLGAVLQKGEARLTLPAPLEARAMLPSSLMELVESFLGTREVYNDRPISARPLRRTWMALDRPLDAERREFVTVPAAKAPPSYAPVAIAIAAGRWLGAGPLGLLYLGRLANALVAVTLLAWAVRLMPVGREMTMLFGLLPTATYEYASVSADATVITTAFLFTAVALRPQFRGYWKPGEVALAIVSGLVFCTQKPVYALLLLIGLPAAFVRGRVKHTLLVHVAILAIVLGGTASWLWFASSMQSVPKGTSVLGQLSFIAEHPLAYIQRLAGTLWHTHFYYRRAVGMLGWDQEPLPGVVYALPVLGFLLGTAAQSRYGPRLPALAVAWSASLVAGSVVLIMTAAYLLYNQVGSLSVDWIAGRYFLPLLALAAAAWCSIVRVPLSRQASLANLLMLAVVIIAEQVITVLTIVRAYHEF
jgi:hypothetical protein